MTGEKKTKRLDSRQKRYVVKCLAEFMTPTEVAEHVKEEMDLEISPQAVSKYDPTKYAGQKLSDELKKLFWSARREFIDDESEVDISHRKWRLKQLSKLYRLAVENGKDVVAAQHLAQAAKERGGLYTNRRKLEVDDKRKTLAQILKIDPETLPKESVH